MNYVENDTIVLGDIRSDEMGIKDCHIRINRGDLCTALDVLNR